jgi:tol-pal system protein YbgF
MRGCLRLYLALALLVLGSAGAGIAQDDQTLADIRQELTVLNVEVQRLKRELSTTGSPQSGSGGATLIDRVNSIESELARLTSKAEELEFRIGRIAADGTRQINDLAFRLCDLEADCDIAELGDNPLWGGDAAAAAATPARPTEPSLTTDTSQLAATERADFENAQRALEEGQFNSAAEQFRVFNETYPGSPLAIAAYLLRGEALEGTGDTREGARSYLEAFRVDQTGPLAAESLFLLGRALGRLGETNEACVTLGEVTVRFPGSDSAPKAQSEMLSIGC